jgi:hypothetical protein
MKKIIRLTESDLIKVIKKVILEEANSDNAESLFRTKYPEVVKMIEYADQKVGSTMNSGAYYWKDGSGMYAKTSAAGGVNLLGADDNTLIFTALNNGQTSITYSNDYGIDPTPIPFPKTFNEFKTWFDSVGMFG